MPTLRRYFTTFEASQFLAVSLPTVVNWIKANRLKAHRTPGGHRRIARDELASFIRRHAMPMPSELSEEGSAARVLVVHGKSAKREAVLSRLRRAGYVCAGAADGFSAGLSVGHFRPDLLLIDLSTPGLDGASVSGALRALDPPRALPILAMSDGRDEKALKHALAQGFDDLLTRPFVLEVVKRKIEQALRARRAA